MIRQSSLGRDSERNRRLHFTILKGPPLMQFLINLTSKEEGQGMVEYGIILGLVSVLAIGALTLMGTDITNVFTSIGGQVGNLPGAAG